MLPSLHHAEEAEDDASLQPNLTNSFIGDRGERLINFFVDTLLDIFYISFQEAELL